MPVQAKDFVIEVDDRLDRLVVPGDGRDLPLDSEELVNRHLRGTHGKLHCEHNVVRDLDELAHKGEVLRTRGHRRWAVCLGARHEHAGDVRHAARDAGGAVEDAAVEIEMAAQLGENFGAVAVRHRFGHEVADSVWMERIPPKHLHVFWLAREMGLVIEHERHQPVRVFERHKSARSRFVAREFPHLIEEGGCGAGHGEGRLFQITSG